MTPTSYESFLASKAARARLRGLADVPSLAPHLFPFQRHCVDFALRAGCAGLYLDTGLGKTECQLEWCHRAIEKIGGQALILTPLAVAGQTKRRADRWGYEARVVREQTDCGPGINICNYDRIDKLDPQSFSAVSLDEASIIKNFTGKTTRALTRAFAGHRFKLVATATPAPNDHMEFGTQSEFLEVMASNEMLSRFFINDTSTASQHWRLKGHAVGPFWEWVASWARMAEKPSDLGDSDDGFILPPFKVIQHRSRDSNVDADFAGLFGALNVSATNMHDIKRQTSTARAESVAACVALEPHKSWILWCDTNDEADALKAAIPSAFEVRGSQTADEKEEILEDFASGRIKHLVTKPSMCGYGLDWSHCSRMAFVGRTFSYETWYQAIRRCWRFGQKKEVIVHLVVAEGEDAIGRVIDRKADGHNDMKSAMRRAMHRASGKAAERMVAYAPQSEGRLPSWL